MKKHYLIIAIMALALGMMSCGKNEIDLLVGRWGLERLEYYYIDYYGQPIESTIASEDFTPGDMENGIEIVFYNNKHGEWIDRDRDTFIIQVSVNPVAYDTIINPDTVLVTNFTYSYDEDLSALFIRTSDAETFQLNIELLNDTSFIYVNEFMQNEVERAVMRRIDTSNKVKSAGKSSKRITRPEGSLFNKMSLYEQR